nr:TraR/DksA C4-type zinc finger protein [Paenibacillus bovis]
MISDQQLSQLKKELNEQKKQLTITDDDESFQNRSARENIGELSLYDNHPADVGTAFYEREKDMALSIHAQDELGKVEHALEAIEKGSYGQCEVCGTDIPFERLEAVPATTFCKEHSPDQRVPGDRPVEEEIIIPATDNSFTARHDSPNEHYDDSFEEVARFGTSETPSDFVGDHDDYNELYQDESKDGTQEEYETFSVTDISGKYRSTIQSDEQVEYKEMLDEAGMDSPIGDIPYHEKDSYVNDKEDEDK